MFVFLALVLCRAIDLLQVCVEDDDKARRLIAIVSALVLMLHTFQHSGGG